MKTLIATTSPLYMKRLVREANGLIDGFYASFGTFSVRCNRARLQKGELQCHSFSVESGWFTPSTTKLEDVYSRDVVASRK